MNTAVLSQPATQARGLAMDAVHACNSGHLGLPLGCAEIGAVLYGGGGLRYFPDAPKWPANAIASLATPSCKQPSPCRAKTCWSKIT